MGFDWDIQRLVTLPTGLHFECGYMDFSNGSPTTEVVTTMTNIISGFGIVQTDDDGKNFGLVATQDGSISSNAVTFTRQTGYILEDARYYYVLLGW